MNVSVTVDSWLALELGAEDPDYHGSIILDTPILSPEGSFVYKALRARVHGSMNLGYDLTILDTDDNNTLSSDDATITSYVPALSEEVTSAANGTGFPLNRWGFAIGSYGDEESLTFQGVPTAAAQTIASEDNIPTVGYSDTLITFALNLSGFMAPATYSDAVRLTAIAKPGGVNPNAKTIFDITYMQEMTAEICANTTKPDKSILGTVATSGAGSNYTGTHTSSDQLIPLTTLIDQRDYKTYLVAKLADGNCWMVQNLALAGGTVLDDTDSDLPEGITYTLPTSSTAGFNNNAGQYMFDGTHIGLSDTSGNITEASAWDNSSNNTGGYYSWLTAIANNAGEDVPSGDAAADLTANTAIASICPKGWKLPTSTASGQFQALYTTYGNKSNFDSIWHPGYGGYYYSSSTTPLYLGTGAYWWSSVSGSPTNAYNLDEYTSGGISPSYSNYRLYGFPLRCIAEAE